MKTNLRRTFLLAAAVATAAWLTTPLAAQNGRNDRAAEAALQAAINREVVDGNLSAAIEQYTKVIASHANSRAVAAKALYLLGQAHEKLGSAEARKAYERIARDFADQKDVVADAGRRLAAMSGTPASPKLSTSLVLKDGKVDTLGAVSLDGHFISSVDWSNGDLILHEIGTGQHRVIADAKNGKARWGAFAQESAISHDSKLVAYSWWTNENDRYELHVANLIGDPNPRRLFDHPSVKWIQARDWSIDGQWVVVLISLKEPTTEGTDQLGLVSVANGSLRLLRSGFWHGSTRVFVSPDGKYVGYDLPQGISNERDVWVTAIDGSGHALVVEHRSNDVMMGWAPDGKRLLFCSDRTGSSGLWSVPFSEGKPRGPAELVKADMSSRLESIGITRTGALFYGTHVRNRRRGGVFVGTFDSAGVTSSRNISDNYLEDNWNPCWSPDGKYLAYSSTRNQTNSPNVIVIRSAETNRVIRELPLKLQNGGTLAGWEPNSRSLLVTGRERDARRSGAFRVNPESGDMEFLFELPSSQGVFPVWSRDGLSILSKRQVEGTEEHAIVQREVATGTEKEVIRRRYLGIINLSPDGNYLATETVDFSSNERLLLVLPLRGGEPREVLRVPASLPPEDLSNYRRGAQVRVGHWTPDSRSFIARKSSDYMSGSELWRVPLDGGTPRKLDAVLGAQIAKFTMNADGRTVAYRKNEPDLETGGPEIWVLENFLPAAK